MIAPISNDSLRSARVQRSRPASTTTPARLAFLVAIVALCNVPAVVGQKVAPDEPASVRTAAHFLEQATFGPTATDVAAVEASGVQQWLDQQFAMSESAMPDGLDVNGVRNQLFLNMVNGSDQLRQRTIFALSQIIVVSAAKNNSGEELIPWVRLLSSNAFGNYRTLLRDVTLSPTMGKYLDLAYSRKASATSSPNENYPRELLQLFTIGLWLLNQDGSIALDGAGNPIPTYTQDTIKEFARALTGWTFPTMPGATPQNSNPQYFVGWMEPRTTTHDTGAKTLLQGVTLPAGQSTTADMEAVLDNIFQHPNVPPFVATRLIRSLVTSNAGPAYIQRVANAFANNGQGVRGDMKAVLRAIFTDPDAQSFSVTDGRLKDPILHVVGLARALGATVTDPNQYMYVFSNLTQRPLTPATVFSFYSPLGTLPGHTDLYGPEFGIYPPALAIQRANFVYGLLNGQFGAGFTLDLAPYQALAANPAGLVDRVNNTLMFGRMTTELRDLILAATAAVPSSDTRQRALGALYLAAISSEYSVYGDHTGAAATTVQPPTALAVDNMAGNLVTLRWKAPLIGPPPAGYVMEAGVHPGEVLASIPTGTNAPTFTFAAPPGSYYVRVHSLASGSRSRASSEIRIHVNAASGPTAPTQLLGVVSGSTLGLSWVNTFGAGAPTAMALDVTGAIATSLPLPLGETFSFSGVPPGTYTFSVRAVNASGSSGASNPVTLTFPGSCSGGPSTPTDFVAGKSGNTISLSWRPAASGRATLSYLVNVSGAFTGSIPTTARSLSGAVGPGTYNISVRAVNPCGNSSATATQTITIP